LWRRATPHSALASAAIPISAIVNPSPIVNPMLIRPEGGKACSRAAAQVRSQNPNESISRPLARNAQDAADGHQMRLARRPVGSGRLLTTTRFGVHQESLESIPVKHVLLLSPCQCEIDYRFHDMFTHSIHSSRPYLALSRQLRET